MPLARFDKLDDAQKGRLLAAAQAEFAQHGYEEASLARVAAQADISKGTLYYYFADRDDLYATVVLRMVQAVASDAVLGSFAPRRAADFWPDMETLFRAGFELARQHPEEVRVLRSFQVSLRRHPRPAFAPILALITANLRVIVETGRRLGCVRSDIDVGLLIELLQSTDEVLDAALHQSGALGDGRALEGHMQLALDTFRRLMEPPRAPAPRGKRKQRGGP